MLVLFFFFSSRRRHTRYIGDWSSDVCSSDLAADCLVKAATDKHALRRAAAAHVLGQAKDEQRKIAARSEERRVGKECRSRRSREHDKKKERAISGQDEDDNVRCQ